MGRLLVTAFLALGLLRLLAGTAEGVVLPEKYARDPPWRRIRPGPVDGQGRADAAPGAAWQDLGTYSVKDDTGAGRYEIRHTHEGRTTLEGFPYHRDTGKLLTLAR